MITKTRKQGNSIMLTVPKEFDVPNGVEVEAKLVENGILYEFLEPKKEFFDFSEDVLADILSEGYNKKEILKEFKNGKSPLGEEPAPRIKTVRFSNTFTLFLPNLLLALMGVPGSL